MERLGEPADNFVEFFEEELFENGTIQLRRKRLTFRSLNTSEQCFRPLHHRPEQVLDWIIFVPFKFTDFSYTA